MERVDYLLVVGVVFLFVGTFFSSLFSVPQVNQPTLLYHTPIPPPIIADLSSATSSAASTAASAIAHQQQQHVTVSSRLIASLKKSIIYNATYSYINYLTDNASPASPSTGTAADDTTSSSGGNNESNTDGSLRNSSQEVNNFPLRYLNTSVPFATSLVYDAGSQNFVLTIAYTRAYTGSNATPFKGLIEQYTLDRRSFAFAQQRTNNAMQQRPRSEWILRFSDMLPGQIELTARSRDVEINETTLTDNILSGATGFVYRELVDGGEGRHYSLRLYTARKLPPEARFVNPLSRNDINGLPRISNTAPHVQKCRVYDTSDDIGRNNDYCIDISLRGNSPITAFHIHNNCMHYARQDDFYEFRQICLTTNHEDGDILVTTSNGPVADRRLLFNSIIALHEYEYDGDSNPADEGIPAELMAPRKSLFAMKLLGSSISNEHMLLSFASFASKPDWKRPPTDDDEEADAETVATEQRKPQGGVEQKDVWTPNGSLGQLKNILNWMKSFDVNHIGQGRLQISAQSQNGKVIVIPFLSGHLVVLDFQQGGDSSSKNDNGGNKLKSPNYVIEIYNSDELYSSMDNAEDETRLGGHHGLGRRLSSSDNDGGLPLTKAFLSPDGTKLGIITEYADELLVLERSAAQRGQSDNFGFTGDEEDGSWEVVMNLRAPATDKWSRNNKIIEAQFTHDAEHDGRFLLNVLFEAGVLAVYDTEKRANTAGIASLVSATEYPLLFFLSGRKFLSGILFMLGAFAYNEYVNARRRRNQQQQQQQQQHVTQQRQDQQQQQPHPMMEYLGQQQQRQQQQQQQDQIHHQPQQQEILRHIDDDDEPPRSPLDGLLQVPRQLPSSSSLLASSSTTNMGASTLIMEQSRVTRRQNTYPRYSDDDYHHHHQVDHHEELLRKQQQQQMLPQEEEQQRQQQHEEEDNDVELIYDEEEGEGTNNNHNHNSNSNSNSNM